MGLTALILIISLILFLAFSLFYNKIAISQISTTKQYSYNLASKVDTTNQIDQIVEEATASEDIQTIQLAESWITYTQPEDGYSFFYPKNWFLRTCSNGNYDGNLGLSDHPLNDPCISDSPPKSIPLISLFAQEGKTVEELVEEAKKDLPSLFFEVAEKKTDIDNKEYKQLVLILKFIPAFFEGTPIPTKSVLTYVDFPEKNQVIIVGFNALDDTSKNADIYRQIISSIKKVD